MLNIKCIVMNKRITLQDYWEQKTIPAIDLVFADGRVIMLEENWCRKKYNISQKSTLEEFERLYGEEPEDIIQILFEPAINPFDGCIAYYGAGGMGNEVFIAYTDNQNKLLWSMFFDFSNIFIDAKIVDNKIIATTENRLIFTIPVENPERISCIPTESLDIEVIKEKEEKYTMEKILKQNIKAQKGSFVYKLTEENTFDREKYKEFLLSIALSNTYIASNPELKKDLVRVLVYVIKLFIYHFHKNDVYEIKNFAKIEEEYSDLIDIADYCIVQLSVEEKVDEEYILYFFER